MANLSQLRRQRMLAFLEKMREQHKDDDEVLSAINEVENEINEKKYGLVWERHSEKVEERMVDEVPIFVEDDDKEITLSDDDFNFLLEGDNLHSLHLLEKTHKEKIGFIYIDPPYNTEGKDFIYDDDYVAPDDSFKHSKWVSFMRRRLEIAHRLLAEDGVIFISIDEHEQANLTLICDEIFGEKNRLATFARLTTKSGKTPLTYMISHDYVLCYVKNRQDIIIGEDFVDSSYKYEDEFVETRGKYNLKQPLDCNSIGYSKSMDYPIEHDGVTYYAGGSKEKYEDRQNGNYLTKDYAWRWSKELYEFGLANGWIVFKNGRIYTKGYLNATIGQDDDTGEYCIVPREKSRKYSTIDFVENEFSNDIAKKQLRKVGVTEKFDYPKPVSLIKKLLKSYYKKDCTVLDFFAGSGTTGQAILELNKEDGGNRHFIVCTDNENNICEGVTYPRLKTVITGTRQDGSKYSEGIPANLKYYRTDYIPKKNDNLVNDLIAHIDEMIQLEYGVKIDKEKYISILSDEDADELEKNWANYPNIKAIYISRSVLLTGKQRELFETHDCFTIPDYYFREELREAGEA